MITYCVKTIAMIAAGSKRAVEYKIILFFLIFSQILFISREIAVRNIVIIIFVTVGFGRLM